MSLAQIQAHDRDSRTFRDRQLLDLLILSWNKPKTEKQVPEPAKVGDFEGFKAGGFARVTHHNKSWHYLPGAFTLEPGDLLYVHAVVGDTVHYEAKSVRKLTWGEKGATVRRSYLQPLPGVIGLRVCMRGKVYAAAYESQRFQGVGTIVGLDNITKNGDLQVRVRAATAGSEEIVVPLNTLTLTVPQLDYRGLLDQLKDRLESFSSDIEQVKRLHPDNAAAERRRVAQEKADAEAAELKKRAEIAEQLKIEAERQFAERKKAEECVRNLASQYYFVSRHFSSDVIHRPDPSSRSYQFLRWTRRNWGVAFFAFAWLADTVLPRYQVLARLTQHASARSTLHIYGTEVTNQIKGHLAQIAQYPIRDGSPQIAITYGPTSCFQIGTFC